MPGNEDDAHDDLGLLGPYRVVRCEKDGSMWRLGWGVDGITYRARLAAEDGKTDAPLVLLKVSAWQVNEKVTRALAALKHPHVAALLGTDRTPDGRSLLAVEWAAGESLTELGQRRGKLPSAEALALVRQVALGLQAASGVGLVHPHLQPADVRFAAAGEDGKENVLKIVGYEAAALIAPSPGRWGGEGTGGPRWLSPEEKEGRAADLRTDIYKLGLVLWFLLVGESPLPLLLSGSNNNLPQSFLDRLPANGESAPVRALLTRLLARAPGERPQTAGELLQEIETCQEGRLVPAPPVLPFSAAAETSTGDTTCIPLETIKKSRDPETTAEPTPASPASKEPAAKSPALAEQPALEPAAERSPAKETAAAAASTLQTVAEPAEAPRRKSIGALAGALTLVLLVVAGGGFFLRQRYANRPAAPLPNNGPLPDFNTVIPSVAPTPLPSVTPARQPAFMPPPESSLAPSDAVDPKQTATELLVAAERAEAAGRRGEAVENYAAACATAGEEFARARTPAGRPYAEPAELQSELPRYDEMLSDPARRNADAFLGRGNLHLALRQWQAAADDYAQALQLDPKSTKAEQAQAFAKAAAAAAPSSESPTP